MNIVEQLLCARTLENLPFVCLNLGVALTLERRSYLGKLRTKLPQLQALLTTEAEHNLAVELFNVKVLNGV